VRRNRARALGLRKHRSVDVHADAYREVSAIESKGSVETRGIHLNDRKQPRRASSDAELYPNTRSGHPKQHRATKAQVRLSLADEFCESAFCLRAEALLAEGMDVNELDQLLDVDDIAEAADIVRPYLTV
jgi:hypothetical protein